MDRPPYCKHCGYCLAGLGAGKCPECAREFDPASPPTYDSAPRRSRRLRWLRRIGAVLLLGALLVAFFPRGYADASLAIMLPDGSIAGFTRVELMPPAWFQRVVNAPYPGWTRRAPDVPLTPGLAIEFRAGGRRFTAHGAVRTGLCTATCGPSESAMQLNGVPLMPGNADAIFATVVPDIAAGRSFGVSIGSAEGTMPTTTTRHTIPGN